ncbi:DMT family transporter [Pseudodesulfovibrio sediminis]|uniref:Permease n=1 Tax=Pseudodesulfovibrio sediminis TaxID=2810563 RepID=A0ABM7P3C9_9BACT|nr:DMT family transporter [Pseudodesulfovibrio sediminis]BCS87261.1 permease [Pseudodesulfovibrio sediminis]
MNKRPLGLFFALLAVIIWSGNFVIASGIVDSIPPITLATLRWITAAVVFLPFSIKSMLRERKALREHWFSLLVAAITGVTMFNTLVYVSAQTTDTVNMALFASTTPVFVVILARIFLGETITLFRSIGLLIAISGMLTIATRGHLDVLLNLTFRIGDIWMLLAGFLWAVYSILVKKKPKTISQYSYLGTVFLVGAIPLIPAAIIEQPFYPAWSLTPAIIGATLYIGIGASLVAFFLWNYAVMYIGPGTSSLFQYFLPVFSGIGSYFLLGQPVTVAHGVGFVLIFMGVVMATRPR